MDTLPDLSQPFPLSDSDVRAYRKNGHVIVRSLATAAEVVSFRPALLEAGAAGRYDFRPLEERDTMREAMTVIYYADGTRVGRLDHPNRQFDCDTWLGGCQPGEVAAGPLNPVLYNDASDSGADSDN